MCMLLPPPNPLLPCTLMVHKLDRIECTGPPGSGEDPGGVRGGGAHAPPPFETEPARNAEVCHALSVTQRTSLYETYLHVLQYIERSNLQLPSLRDSSLAVPQTQGLIRKGKASEKRQYHESPGFTLL